MDMQSKILALITLILLLLWVGPGAIRMNMARGTTLRHIAIWLTIIIALMWIYKFVPRY